MPQPAPPAAMAYAAITDSLRTPCAADVCRADAMMFRCEPVQRAYSGIRAMSLRARWRGTAARCLRLRSPAFRQSHDAALTPRRHAPPSLYACRISVDAHTMPATIAPPRLFAARRAMPLRRRIRRRTMPCTASTPCARRRRRRLRPLQAFVYRCQLRNVRCRNAFQHIRDLPRRLRPPFCRLMFILQRRVYAVRSPPTIISPPRLRYARGARRRHYSFSPAADFRLFSSLHCRR